MGVEDVEASTRFYEALDWQRSSRSVPGVISFLQGGANVLGLYGRRALAEDVGVASLPAGSGSVTHAMNVPQATLVEVWLEAARPPAGPS